MKRIAIFVEGGGDTAQQKAELRTGFDELLKFQKQAARIKRLSWKLVPSGGRNQAFEAFINEIQNSDAETLSILLVDSEEAAPAEIKNQPEVNDQSRKHHLTKRDGWNLNTVEADRMHLMVQCMEAWIVADPEALANYYRQGFRANLLPVRNNLEDEPKADVYSKLAAATRETQKGEYAKIKHASKLLALVSPDKVANRCPRFRTFAEWLTRQIEAA